MHSHDLKHLLELAGRTPKWLAQKSGYSIRTIYGVIAPNAEHTSKNPRTIEKLAKILENEIGENTDRAIQGKGASIVIRTDIGKDRLKQIIDSVINEEQP